MKKPVIVSVCLVIISLFLFARAFAAGLAAGNSVGSSVLQIPIPDKASPASAEVLYNGIRLPAEWPPRGLKAESDKPMPVPYLKNPPAVIPIDIGRQLFVDDFLVENTTLRRVFHAAKQYPGNPVLTPSTDAELRRTETPEGEQEAVCYLGAGGVFYDPEDLLFKMFYTAGWRGGLALATSRDGFEWTRPALNAKGENIVLPPGFDEPGAGFDNCAYLDVAAKNADERYKFITQRRKGLHTLHVSKDGLNWSRGVPAGQSADYCSFFYNPFRNVWVQSIKLDGPRGRMRHYAESADFLTRNIYDRSVYWVNADCLDKPDPNIKIDGKGTQLYNLHGIAYESLMLGMFSILLGPSNRVIAEGKFPKTIDLKLGFSRDGFHWDRPEREPFIRATRKEGDWNRGQLNATAGVCLVVGDWLYFPYSGSSGVSPSGWKGPPTGISIGMAILRRDGFASMEAQGEGALTTRPVVFSGRRFFVNVSAPGGKLLAQITGIDGKPIAPFTFENCESVSGDTTIGQMSWKGGGDLSALAGKPVRFEFKLTQGKLYAFWVSRDESGRSDGFLAGGGPGYTGLIDTVGRAALRHNAAWEN
jgi:hypothetical protein